MAFPIQHDYHAIHNSGKRSTSAIKYLVIHDMENDNANLAAEGTGSWFENSASGGSTHYGLDNNSIQQYLDDNVIAWGARGGGVNKTGLHVEVVGKASHSRQQWLSEHKPALDRLSWLLWYKGKQYGIPMKALTDAQLAAGREKGIITHSQVTRVFKVAGGHTDPGTGFPLDIVVRNAANLTPKPTNPLPGKEPSTSAVKTCIGNGVNIRRAPWGKVIGHLDKGDKVIVTGNRQLGFLGIRKPMLGWVSAKYLR